MSMTQGTGVSNWGVSNRQQIIAGMNTINVGTIERWVSLLGGSALTVFGIYQSISRGKPSIVGSAFLLLGGGLIYRAVTGHSFTYQALDIDTTGANLSSNSISFEKAMTINRSPEEMYHFWQDFGTNQQTGEATTQGTPQLSEERKQEIDAWNALKETVVANSGYIHFEKAPDGRGTEVRVVLSYTPALSKLGNTVSFLAGKSPEQQITEDLLHFKEVMDSGQAAQEPGITE